jgi:hypothetical protein
MPEPPENKEYEAGGFRRDGYGRKILGFRELNSAPAETDRPEGGGVKDIKGRELVVPYGLEGVLGSTYATKTETGSLATKTEAEALVIAAHHAEDAKGNIAIGTTLPALTTGQYNTILGVGAGAALTTGSFNTALGHGALATNKLGVENVAIGWNTLGAFDGDSEHGTNVAIGNGAMEKATTASECIAIGQEALSSNLTSGLNMAIGSYAGQHTTGLYNQFVGNGAGQANTTGTLNTAIGESALGKNKTGGENTALGREAGLEAEGSNNLFLGFSAGRKEKGSNKLYIATDETTEPLIYGEFPNAKLKLNVEELVLGKSGGTLALYGGTVVVKPKTTGTTAGFTIKGYAATEAGLKKVLEESTFTGGKGPTAYTLSDVVLALKQIGALTE